MTVRKIKIGIMPKEQYRQRTIDIAAGKYIPSRNEPKIWFNSFKAMGEVLNEKNMELIRIIYEKKPDSLTTLARLSKRQLPNVSRTVRTLQAYKLIETERKHKATVPIAKAKDFKVESYDYMLENHA